MWKITNLPQSEVEEVDYIKMTLFIKLTRLNLPQSGVDGVDYMSGVEKWGRFESDCLRQRKNMLSHQKILSQSQADEAHYRSEEEKLGRSESDC